MKPILTSLRIWPLWLGIAFLSSCQQEASEDPILHLIGAASDSLLAQPEIKALTVGMIYGDKRYILHSGQLLDGSRPTDESLYEIASLSKTFVGTILAKALVEGKMSLDDDIRQYLAGDYPNLEYEAQPILVRHVVSHQSGLPRMFPDHGDLFGGNPDWDSLPYTINRLQEQFSREQFFESLSQVQLDTIPGHHLNYSNAGANLMAYMLADVYGQRYEALLEQQLFQPLNMSHTGIRLTDIDLNKLARGQNGNGREMPIRAEKEMSAEGGIISNVDDMLQYLSFHLDESHPWVAQSHTGLWEGRYGDYDTGLFWQIFRDGDQPDRIFQNGGAYGTSSWVCLIPERQIAIFMITNVAASNTHQSLSEAIDHLLLEIEQLEMTEAAGL